MTLQQKYDRIMDVMGREGMDENIGFYQEPLRIGDCIQYIYCEKYRYVTKEARSKGWETIRKLCELYRPLECHHLPIEPTEERSQVIDYLYSLIPTQ